MEEIRINKDSNYEIEEGQKEGDRQTKGKRRRQLKQYKQQEVKKGRRGNQKRTDK
ncbi:3816_t:CDS:1, partial [Ambispora gerdemannii]